MEIRAEEPQSETENVTGILMEMPVTFLSISVSNVSKSLYFQRGYHGGAYIFECRCNRYATMDNVLKY